MNALYLYDLLVSIVQEAAAAAAATALALHVVCVGRDIVRLAFATARNLPGPFAGRCPSMCKGQQ